MNSQSSNDEELHRHERELRLREIEAEINQPSLSRIANDQEAKGALNRRHKQIREVTKFVGIVIAVVVAVRVARWLATAVVISAIVWIVYTIFFKNDRNRR